MTAIPETLANALQDRYRLERELGAGGMATVYLAHDFRHGRQVAVKVLHPELSAVLGGDRFVSEIRTTAQLQHPHILPLFDSGEAAGNLFYVMPVIEGETLRSRLGREKQLPVPDAVRLAREIAEALDYAHRHGVIHRDIKPENILLHDGRALVADFGIALAVQSAGGQRMTQTGLSLGTPQYMSPEQAMGEREITARSDIYSLGVVAYEMLTGEPPFTGPTSQSIVARVLTEEPRPIGPQRKSVPPEVESAILTALEKLPADRFGSAADFASSIAGETAAPRRATGVRAAASASPGRQKFLLPGLAAALVAAAALAIWGWMRSSPVAVPPVTRYLVDLPGGGEAGYGSRIAISPDGSKLVFMAPDPDGGTQLWLRSSDRIDAVPIPGTRGAVSPFFSPDGARLAFTLDNPSVLKVMRLDVDESRPVDLATNVGLAGGSWGADGFLYLDGLGTSLVRVPETGGGVEQLRITDSTGVDYELTMPYALPGGRGLIVTMHRSQRLEDWVIGVVDLSTMKVRGLFPGVAGFYLVPGRLLTVTVEGELSVVPFDVNTMTVTGASTVFARGINLTDPWGVDLGLAGNALAYASAPVTRDSLQFGWIGAEGSFEPLSNRWVDWLDSGVLSPDGARIAYTLRSGQGGDIWVRHLGNGALTRLSLGNQRSYDPVWSRDGKAVFYSRITENGHIIVSRPADASTGETVRARGPNFLYGGRESRDGSTLVYSNYDNATHFDLLMVEAGDTVPKPLLVTTHNESDASLSPDGKWLAYSSDESGSSRVYVRPFPNVQQTVWQVSGESGDFAEWSADGREIYYRSGNTIEAVEVLAGPSFAVGRSRTVARLDKAATGRWTWGVRKDGRVLVLRRVSAPPSLKIVVTQNLSGDLPLLKQ